MKTEELITELREALRDCLSELESEIQDTRAVPNDPNPENHNEAVIRARKILALAEGKAVQQ